MFGSGFIGMAMSYKAFLRSQAEYCATFSEVETPR